MASFILIPGAGGIAWYWHRVTPLLEAGGHAAVAVDLPGDDETAGLSEYAERIAEAARGYDDLIVVAQSLGGFTAPIVCERIGVRALVLVNAMIPMPNETAGAWGKNTGSSKARVDAARRHGYDEEFDVATYFMHDVPPDVAAEGEKFERDEAETIFEEPCRFLKWPDVPVHVIAGADDRLFPLAFQRRVAAERLGATVDVLPGGHLIALSHPHELAEQLLSYIRQTR